MHHAPGETAAAGVRQHAPVSEAHLAMADQAMVLLTVPGLIVIHGGPGCGRSSLLRHLGETFRGPVYAGGGLAMLQSVPAFALSRAVRVRLPTTDAALLAEAVRSRVRGGLLLIDDLQWADPLTVSALAALAAHCRVAVALRTPHRLPADSVASLKAAAAGWMAVPPLDTAAAAALARALAPALTPAALADVVRRAGGVPLAVEALTRHRASRPSTEPVDDHADQVAYAVAAALSDLTRPARTVMAALGLLGRPATTALLGAGVDELAAAGLVSIGPDDLVSPASPYVAEVAAGMLDVSGRVALHRRLADLVPPREAARHLAAAGDGSAAYDRAVAAAEQAATIGERAELLLLACDLPGVDPRPEIRTAAAAAAMACGQPRTAARLLEAATPLGVDVAALRGEALLQAGDLAAARAVAEPIPDSAAPHLVAARDRILLLVDLADDAGAAALRAKNITTRHGDPPTHAGLRAALAAVRAATRASGWEQDLASAASAAGAAGEALAARWSAWLLVETLIADGRLTEAAQAAHVAAEACAVDLAYSWQTRFLAARLWCTAMRGGSTNDEVLRHAGDLSDRTLPALARGYAVAAASLVQADGGLLAPARERLAATSTGSALADSLLAWVGQEAAWLDGQPEHAVQVPTGDGSFIDGLRRITAHWAAFDGARLTLHGDEPQLAPIRRTLAAWAGSDGFDQAAVAWRDLSVREEVRCLLAQGLHENDSERAVPPLLAAEQMAGEFGLVILGGRARRALRRHAVRRDSRGPRAGDELTDRECDVLRLVAAGEPTRRIAGQLGISGETVETHIRSGMRKLGARTRTEAAALALEILR